MRGTRSLAESAGLKTEVMEKAKNAMMSNWKNVANYREHKTKYLEYTNGYYETTLGDKIYDPAGADSAVTTGVN